MSNNMAYYVRKISRSKWQENQLSTDTKKALEEIKSVKADAITNCIKTTGNKLSLWKVEEKKDSIEDIVPLIIGFERPDTCDIIYEYYGAAEPPVRCGESHLSGLTEPPHFVY